MTCDLEPSGMMEVQRLGVICLYMNGQKDKTERKKVTPMGNYVSLTSITSIKTLEENKIKVWLDAVQLVTLHLPFRNI